MFFTAIKTFDPTTPLTVNDENLVRAHFESIWSRPPNAFTNQPIPSCKIRKINFKVKNTPLIYYLKAEKMFRPHIKSLVEEQVTLGVTPALIRKQRDPFSPELLSIMLLVHYDDVKYIPVAGRNRPTLLTSAECKNVLENVFVRRLLSCWIRYSSKLSVTISASHPPKARWLPIMKRIKSGDAEKKKIIGKTPMLLTPAECKNVLENVFVK